MSSRLLAFVFSNGMVEKQKRGEIFTISQNHDQFKSNKASFFLFSLKKNIRLGIRLVTQSKIEVATIRGKSSGIKSRFFCTTKGKEPSMTPKNTSLIRCDSFLPLSFPPPTGPATLLLAPLYILLLLLLQPGSDLIPSRWFGGGGGGSAAGVGRNQCGNGRARRRRSGGGGGQGKKRRRQPQQQQQQPTTAAPFAGSAPTDGGALGREEGRKPLWGKGGRGKGEHCSKSLDTLPPLPLCSAPPQRGPFSGKSCCCGQPTRKKFLGFYQKWRGKSLMIAIFQSVHNFPFAISALEETELPSKKLFAFSLPQKIQDWLTLKSPSDGFPFSFRLSW